MRRRRAAKSLPSDSSDDETPLSKISDKQPKKPKPSTEDSSSESDIENYLQPADKIDLDSPFFNLQKEPPSFEKIENEILEGVNPKTLIDSDSDEETPLAATEDTPSTSKLNFSQLHDYTKKLEEAKRHIEEYNARKQAEAKELNIENLLAAGETKLLSDEKQAELEATLHSSDFESCSDSEKEGWEEVSEKKEKEKNVVPKEGLQITVEMPNPVKKKKGVDLLAAIKRRINRVRKENQVLIHKVHLLCWIAHGNYVNTKINSENVLASALSLVPSQNCFPADRTDLNYLTQILKWFRNTVEIVEKPVTEKPLDVLLRDQIKKKEAFNKKMLVLIFVAILRSLGIQCRVIFSFQVEPLRPPSSELHSLSTKIDKAVSSKTKGKEDTSGVSKSTTKASSRSKSVSDTSGSKEVKSSLDVKSKARSKSTSDIKSKPEGKKVANSKVKEPPKPEADKKQDKKPRSSTRSKSSSDTSKAKTEEVKTNTRSKSTIDSNKAKNPKVQEDKKQKKVGTTLEVEKPKASTRSKSSSNTSKAKVEEVKKTRSKSTSDASKKETETKKVTSKSKPKSKTESQPGNRRSTRSQKPTIPQVDGANDSDTSPKPNLKKLTQKTNESPLKTRPKTLTKYCDSDSEDDFTTRSPFSKKNTGSPQTNGANLKKLKNPIPKSFDVRKDIINIVKKSVKEQKDLALSKSVKKRKSGGGDSEDSDYIPEPIKKKHHDSDDDFAPKVKVKRRVQVKPEEDPKVKKKQGVDVWCEVFMEVEEKWISVDVPKGQLHCVNELYVS